MPIFQKSVIKKYLSNLDKEQVESAYQIFRKNYSPTKIEEIKRLKEEEYQDGFLRDLFVDVLGYTLKPDDNYDLVREFRNQADGRKADGAILKNDKAIAVIELKSTKTKDLKSITEQAFNYKINQADCKYVITSNFQKLRFYIDYTNEFEEFNLFYLDKENFELLYLILSKESIFSDLPLKLKEETKFHEQEISGKLYKDYSDFKNKLFDNLIINNAEHDKLTLFKKSQKLLDRFLFVLFAEDSGLLPPNSISRIVKRYEILKDEDAYKPLYDIFKQYFGYMNTGRKGKTPADNIPEYNGGLFYPDELLDNLKIDDEILIKDLLNLSEYDFNTEVDVNILGHIFEHSLSAMEHAQLTDTDIPFIPKEKAPLRKKDGIFYTPKYITKYIVENTLGTLCSEKRKELDIVEIEFDGTYRLKEGKLSAKGKKLFQKLQDYKDWMFSLKIVDPACGSGAFLNQALNFLIEEHKNIDDIIAELTNTALRLFDTEKAILENNLYGVDINEESVEIAKLSLWLRTAQKGRKLSVLSNNIKCGNSLIDDPEIAGDKAFDWHKEFPGIFRKKKKKIWHITTATHNSRYSQRMFDNYVKTGKPVWLSEKEEIIVTQTIREIAEKDNLNIVAYNICGDHVHLLLVCEEKELPKIVQKLKSMSARACNIAMGRTVAAKGEHAPPKGQGISSATSEQAATSEPAPMSASHSVPHIGACSNAKHAPVIPKRGKTQYHLWTQKFGQKEITSNEQLENTINYIKNNRKKHQLPENKELQIHKLCCSRQDAFRTEYTGGFDVVIGNPPYVRLQGLKANYEKESFFYEKTYQSATANYDIYALFIEKAFKLINKNGGVCFIQPHKFLISDFGIGIRGFLLKHKAVESLLHFGSNMVFKDASTYTCILKLTYNNSEIKFKHLEPEKIDFITDYDKISYDKLTENKWNLTNTNITKVLDKLKLQLLTVKDVFAKIFQGIATSGDKVYLIKGKEKGNYIYGYSQQLDKVVEVEKGLVKPMLKGEDISKYKKLNNQYWVIFPYLLKEGKAEPMTEDYLQENFQKGYTYLKENEEFLRGREHHRFDNSKEWFLFGRNQGVSNVEREKITTPEISLGTNMTYDKGIFYHNTKVYSFIKKDSVKEAYKFFLPILNSSLMWFFIKNTGYELRGGYFTFKTNYLNPFPLPKLENITDQQIFIEKADLMLSLNKQLQEKKNKFLNRVKDNLCLTGHVPLTKISKKLEAFYDYDFKTFVVELKKQKVKLSLTHQVEWEEFFIAYKTEINQLQDEINATDKEIDEMVYKLYELTEDEIEIIEKNIG